jgi:hypothetical protein
MGGLYAQGITPMQMVTREDWCRGSASPSLARRTRFHLLEKRGISRKHGFTVDSLCGNPLCVRDEHVIYRPWKALTKPTKWGEYAKKLAALKVGKSFLRLPITHTVRLRFPSCAAASVRIDSLGRQDSPCAFFLAVRESASRKSEHGNQGRREDETTTHWSRVTPQEAPSGGSRG